MKDDTGEDLGTDQDANPEINSEFLVNPDEQAETPDVVRDIDPNEWNGITGVTDDQPDTVS